MSMSTLRLEAGMIINPVAVFCVTALQRVCHLTGKPAPIVVEALANTPLRFSLMQAPIRKIRVVQ
jgi:hypothetical protein